MKVLNDPAIVKRIRELGAEPLPMTPAEFGAFVEDRGQEVAQGRGREPATKLTRAPHLPAKAGGRIGCDIMVLTKDLPAPWSGARRPVAAFTAPVSGI